MKEAGHHFGVVTEVMVKVYEKEGAEDWAYRQMAIEGGKVEEVFEAINARLDAQSGHLSNDVSIYQDGGDKAVVDLRVFSNGFDLTQLEEYIEPFLRLGPTLNSTPVTDFQALIREMGYDAPPGGCEPPTGSFGSVFGIRVTKHVPSAMRKFYNLFIEWYGTKAVQSVPEKSAAYPIDTFAFGCKSSQCRRQHRHCLTHFPTGTSCWPTKRSGRTPPLKTPLASGGRSCAPRCWRARRNKRAMSTTR
jgi:hypothetical protein